MANSEEMLTTTLAFSNNVCDQKQKQSSCYRPVGWWSGFNSETRSPQQDIKKNLQKNLETSEK